MTGQAPRTTETDRSRPYPTRTYDWLLGGEVIGVPGDEPIPGCAGAARKPRRARLTG